MYSDKHTLDSHRHITLMTLVMVLCVATMRAAADHTKLTQQIHNTQRTTTQRNDTLRHRHTPIEIHDMHSRMMTSPQPVSIHQQGRLLRVESQVSQLLPVYTQNGTFYTAFRLTKGTNWLGGLPRGRYIINNRHFAIN